MCCAEIKKSKNKKQKYVNIVFFLLEKTKKYKYNFNIIL
jgi:hypothetical protein